MPQIQAKVFKGLDLRKLPESDGDLHLTGGQNVIVTPGNSLASAPAQKTYTVLDYTDASVGLYIIGGKIHVCQRWTGAVLPPQDARIVYDYIADTETGDIGNNIVDVSAAVAWDGQPYLCVERSDGSFQHHLLPKDPVIPLPQCTVTSTQKLTVSIPIPSTVKAGRTLELIQYGSTLGTYLISSVVGQVINLATVMPLSGGTVDVKVYNCGKTQVDTPFAPGRSLILAADKIWASDVIENKVWFSSTVNGPSDWINPGDAGILPTHLHVNGHQTLQALAIFNGKLCVFYDNTLQLWDISADPATHRLAGSVGGAGTIHPRSVANVMGDVYYFSNGGFRSVQSVITTGQLKADDIGAPIYALTKYFTNENDIIAMWSEALSMYIAQIDQTYSYALTNSPRSSTFDWSTKWLMGLSNFAELNGVLYGRYGKNVYYFDPNAWDGTSAWATVSYLDGGTPRLKQWGSLYGSQSGAAQWSVLTEPRNESASEIDIGMISGSFDGLGIVYLGCVTNRIAFKFTVGDYTANYIPWTLDNLLVEYKVGNLA